MTEQEAANVEALKRAYGVWIETKGDADAAWEPLIADDFQYRSLAAGRAGAEFTKPLSCKKDLFLDFFDELKKVWVMEDLRIDDYIADGDRVVAIGHMRWKNRESGALFDTPKADIWTFRDGKAVAFMEFMDTAQIIKALPE